MRRSELSQCELIAMKCVWDAKESTTCQEVMDKLKNNYGLEYKDTTVYTFLKNLKDKGFVESKRQGITRYWAIRDEQEYLESQIERAKKFWFNDSSAQFIQGIIKAGKLSKKEKDEIKDLIENFK